MDMRLKDLNSRIYFIKMEAKSSNTDAEWLGKITITKQIKKKRPNIFKVRNRTGNKALP